MPEHVDELFKNSSQCRSYIRKDVANGECIITKAADPEKVAAYRKAVPHPHKRRPQIIDVNRKLSKSQLEYMSHFIE